MPNSPTYSQSEIYSIFREIALSADKALMEFTLNNKLAMEQKADKTIVTQCDEHIDEVCSKMAAIRGFNIVSEEGSKSIETVKSGNYITIDPIDGTLAYLKHINHALALGSLNNFLQDDIGLEWDFCLLLGLVVEGKASFGCVFNYVTKELILIDSQDKQNFIQVGKKRIISGNNVLFLDQRSTDSIELDLKNRSDITTYYLASFGLRAVYAGIYCQSAMVIHRVQQVGLWDIIPAICAINCFGGKAYTLDKQPFSAISYVALPYTGAIIIKGENFTNLFDSTANFIQN